MPSDIRERLQATLGSAFTLERELGGGGMSRVFVATETAFDRRVVVKVLPPELAAGVSVDRFKREILVAARLQHPHIVPVLAAGETDGLPYFTMPFVEGASLRQRLARPLPVAEAVGILKEVARALAYAHEHGVVHRDIKPDNVLITGGTAVVTDFGIAKAITAARTGAEAHATLTSVGTSIGTPTYMAPEQAAGDPATDHRADIYSLGVMAYELLTGLPPFHGLPPHKLLAAHMSELPSPLFERRPDVPPALAELVMRCLAKDADARPQSAVEVVRALEGVNSSAALDAMPEAMRAPRHALPTALGVWAAATVAVAVLAKAAIVGIGLPDWVFPGALVVMALGLPVILFTAFVHRQTQKALTTTPTLTPGGSPAPQGTMATIALKASPHVSWRRTARGGVIAVGAFVVLVAAWMTMRALGIGPAASLMAAGSMGERERVILAEFESPANDTLLGPTVTEAFRTDLAQSANLSVMPENAVREVLRRMQRPAVARVDFALSREIATREGMKAVIDGSVTALGGGYVLAARLVAAQTGEELAVFRQTANAPDELIPAIGKLSRALRSKLGESLRSVQNTPALDRVTTSSLAALQKYVAASRASQLEGDFEKGVRLMEEAVAIDSNFAMAYRRLAVEHYNRRLDRRKALRYIQRAYDLRDRLSDVERYLTLGTYYFVGSSPDMQKGIEAYEGLLDVDPGNSIALNNLAQAYRWRREFAKAEELARRALASQSTSAVYHNNLIQSQIAQGKLDEATRNVDAMAAALPRNPAAALRRVEVLGARGRYDSVDVVLDSLVRNRASDQATLRGALWWRRATTQLRGRLADALRLSAEMTEASERLGDRGARLYQALDSAETGLLFRGDTAGAMATIDRALARLPLDSVSPADRPYDILASLFAQAGRSSRVRDVIADFERSRDEDGSVWDARDRAYLEANLAMAERRYDAAIDAFRRSDAGTCTACRLPELAAAYDLAGNADSAIAVFERYVSGPSDMIRLPDADRLFLAGSHKRLGELYEANGERQKAASHYARFVELWKDADPELQPQVTQVRNRLRELQRAERP